MMFDEFKYCYGFFLRNISVLIQLFSVYYIFEDINQKVFFLIYLCKIIDFIIQLFWVKLYIEKFNFLIGGGEVGYKRCNVDKYVVLF